MAVESVDKTIYEIPPREDLAVRLDKLEWALWDVKRKLEASERILEGLVAARAVQP